MVTVQVIAQATGRPAAGCRVAVSAGWTGLCTEHTDAAGEAHFPSVDPGEAEVYVDGASAFKGRLEGRKVLYI